MKKLSEIKGTLDYLDALIISMAWVLDFIISFFVISTSGLFEIIALVLFAINGGITVNFLFNSLFKTDLHEDFKSNKPNN